ncbi:taurine ABC transporter permease [Burkholderia sp. WAC0059]|uniref:ABC transporter permease n=1 Tax=Burkholderia sp. WAC0059 TaxID=2066022 RepID=UPI000C7F184A|nr:ABC transporter permease [Burkholderia sp. WAC0059]PLZ00621.1 taurine ABC transporter permease [Burkholderia sp. WAC0059]
MSTTRFAWRARFARPGLGLVGPIALIVLWSLAHASHWVSPRLLPGPAETFGALWSDVIQGTLWPDLWATALRTGDAFVIAAAAGIPLGVVLGSSPVVYRSAAFLIDFFRSTPATAMFPLFLLVFGIGEGSKIAVAAFSAWLVIVFNTAYGVMNARKTRILAARVMGASNARVLRDVMFFESLPQTFVGLRLGVSYALVVIIVAEMFIGSSDGMGRRIIDAEQVYDLTQMYATIIAMGCAGYAVNLGFLALERYFVKWAGK